MSHTIIKYGYQTTTPTGLYEANYRRLSRLLPDLSNYEVKDTLSLTKSKITVTILEQHKYTTVIALKQSLQTSFSHLSSIAMELRICHDANVLEVIGYQGTSPVQSALVYPNKHMIQIDEKKQLNLLLKDILENSVKIERHSVSSL